MFRVFPLTILMEYCIFHKLLFELFSNFPPLSHSLGLIASYYLQVNSVLVFKCLRMSGQIK